MNGKVPIFAPFSIYRMTSHIDVSVDSGWNSIESVDHSLFFQLEHEGAVSEQKQFRIEWSVDCDLMNTMKASNTGKCYESEIADDAMWCIQCFPNGDNAASAGDVELYVQLCWLPPNVSRVEVRYSLSCTEAAAKDTRTKEFDHDNDQSAKWSHGVLSFAAFKELDTVTFTVCPFTLSLSLSMF